MNPEFLIVIEFIAFAAIGYSITRIKNIKLRNISFTIFVIAQIICMIILGFKASKYQREKRIANFEEKVGDIYFQGKVISSFTKYKEILLCILLDSTNTHSYYTYARNLALKIENGIAVLPIGILDTNDAESLFKYNAEYVIVNKDKNSEINYIIKNDTLTLPSTAAFWPGKLDEKYMTVFDDIITKNKTHIQ